jgi:hypothetical protein
MSTISKLRHRPEPVIPVAEGKGNAYHSIKKKVTISVPEDEDEEKYARELQEQEEKALDELENGKLDLEEGAAASPVRFDPASTQTKTQEYIITSNEAKYRSDNFPTIHDKVEMRRAELRQKAREQAMKAKLAVKLAAMEEKRIRMEEKARQAEKKRLFGLKGSVEPENDIEVDAEENEEEIDHVTGESNEHDEEYKLAILVSKERKLTGQRLTARAHKPIGYFYLKSVQMKLLLRVGSTGAVYSEILPWLFLGRGNIAQNIHSLTKIGATHILNVTKEVT